MSRYEEEGSSESSEGEEQYESKKVKRKGCPQCGSQAHWYCKPRAVPRAARRPVERETPFATDLHEPRYQPGEQEEPSSEDEEVADYYQSTKKPRPRARSVSPRRPHSRPKKAKPTRCGRCGKLGHNARTCSY